MISMISPSGLDGIRATLEGVGSGPVLIYDPRRLDDDGRQEMRDIVHQLGDRPIPALALHLETLDALFITLPPDRLKSYADGRPVVIFPIIRDEREPNPHHRPFDTVAVKAAKTALSIGTFRVVAAQTEVELASNTRAREATRGAAQDLAVLKIGRAIWRGGHDLHDDGKRKLVQGLLDRASRIVATFMRVKKGAHVARAEAERVRERLDGAGQAAATVMNEIEEDHVAQVGNLVDNQTRAIAHERAMERWSAAVRDGLPMSRAEAIEICNAHADRMASHDLMRIAIAGDLNPADVHRNRETSRQEFEVGRILGRLRRNQDITLEVSHAEILAPTFQIFAEQRLVTERDACAYLLAAEALSCRDLRSWHGILTRISETSAAETVVATPE